jgi:hypothetical protein
MAGEGFENSSLGSTVLATPAAGVLTLKFDKERMPAIFSSESAHNCGRRFAAGTSTIPANRKN